MKTRQRHPVHTGGHARSEPIEASRHEPETGCEPPEPGHLEQAEDVAGQSESSLISDDAPEALQSAMAAIQSLQEHAGAIVQEYEALRANRSLSEEGKKAKVKKFADQRVVAAARSADAAAAALKAEITSLKEKLPTLRLSGLPQPSPQPIGRGRHLPG